MWRRLNSFLRHEIWRLRIRALPPRRFRLLRALRVGLLALRRFAENRCQLHASALTFYTLLALVPVLALAFGVAAGFGLDEQLRTVILERLRGQEETARQLIEFSTTLLHSTSSGIIAGAGMALLGWAAIRLLGQVETSFNEIWGVRRGRSFERKITDYLAISVIGPLLFVVASSATVFITSRVLGVTGSLAGRLPLGAAIERAMGLLPLVVLWVLFGFLYRFIPNTRVSIRAAAIAGVVAGTVYQVIQWTYIAFQISVSRYGAVYGSFAALPLFLLWLQTSWLIVLFGAEISFAVDNEETYEFERECLAASPAFKKAVAVRVAQLCAQAFAEGRPPFTAVSLAHHLNAPIRLIRDRIADLVEARILIEVEVDGHTGEHIQPARSLEQLRISTVLAALDRRGHAGEDLVKPEEILDVQARLEELDQAAARSPSNLPLADGADGATKQAPRPSTEAAVTEENGH